jgi:hypothetical protein
MEGNVDERLLDHWLASKSRNEQARARLERSSLPLERCEGWALDLIAEAVSQAAPSASELGRRRPEVDMLERSLTARIVQLRSIVP